MILQTQVTVSVITFHQEMHKVLPVGLMVLRPQLRTIFLLVVLLILKRLLPKESINLLALVLQTISQIMLVIVYAQML